MMPKQIRCHVVKSRLLDGYKGQPQVTYAEWSDVLEKERSSDAVNEIEREYV